MLPEHGHLNRNYYFGKYLKRLGHEPVAFVGSHPHNTSLQLIEGTEKYRVYQENPFPWVLIKTRNYEGSKKQQILSMFEFYRNTKTASRHFEKPDAIIGSSAHPLAALLAIELGKKYKCKKIVEIRDLWPESIVAYGIAAPKNPAILALRRLEKWIYTHADAIVFTMGGGYDYILEQGWESEIPPSKCHYINNGVDLEAFRYNEDHFQIQDLDLANPQYFKVVYTGSVRKANRIDMLFDAAQMIDNKKIRILIWGDGDELEKLKTRAEREKIQNVVFKGRAEKREIPFILSQGDVLFLDSFDDKIARFGISSNKLFEYFAAGKPILMSHISGHNPAAPFSCSLTYENNPESIARVIQEAASLDQVSYDAMCRNALRAAETYSYSELSSSLETLMYQTIARKLKEGETD